MFAYFVLSCRIFIYFFNNVNIVFHLYQIDIALNNKHIMILCLNNSLTNKRYQTQYVNVVKSVMFSTCTMYTCILYVSGYSQLMLFERSCHKNCAKLFFTLCILIWNMILTVSEWVISTTIPNTDLCCPYSTVFS